MRYLDPKADLTFKKIFGEHKDLLISLLNALLPLADDEQIESVEYLSPELVPETYVGKNSIVDVRCRDVKGRQFIVEMQMLWTEAFKQRVLFNASKAFVRQLDKKRKYELLQPVYSLNLVNETFMKDYPDEFIHNYSVVHEFHSDEIIRRSPLHLRRTAQVSGPLPQGEENGRAMATIPYGDRRADQASATGAFGQSRDLQGAKGRGGIGNDPKRAPRL